MDIYERSIDPVAIRRTIGMVFQKPNPFPAMSIYDNVIAGYRLNGRINRSEADEIVESCLQAGGALGRGQGPAEGELHGTVRAASSSGSA